MSSNYLEEAAQLLRKAAKEVESLSWKYDRRLEIAEAFARLAAIDKGIIPADMLAEVLQRAGVSEGGGQ
jgi:elongation factor P--beta-lysine ligase